MLQPFQRAAACMHGKRSELEAFRRFNRVTTNLCSQMRAFFARVGSLYHVANTFLHSGGEADTYMFNPMHCVHGHATHTYGCDSLNTLNKRPYACGGERKHDCACDPRSLPVIHIAPCLRPLLHAGQACS